jgi:hypothetical protein
MRLIATLARIARRWLPGWLSQLLVRGGTAVLTPVVFSLGTGHLRSSLVRKAVDSSGYAIAWYTYPAIDFLSNKTFQGRNVLEWGAGQSTLWWASRAETVLAFEDDPAWYESIRKTMSQNVEIHLIAPNGDGAANYIGDRKFDVVVIDGLNRLNCAEKSVELVTDDGAIILDNSEGYWGARRRGEYPILDLFRAQGFQRIDFYGHAPGVIRPHCTSLFFKSRCFLLEGTDRPRRRYAS